MTPTPSEPPPAARPPPGPEEAWSGSHRLPLAAIGRYRVLGELGRGGMGIVYRAFDPALGRQVAIKVLGPSLGARDPEELGRFLREARVTAKLRHPAIVAVHEVGEHAGWPFIVMDLVAGETLEAELQRAPSPPRRIAAIVERVARALDHAHAHGVLHRDVKPGNILIDETGEPRLTDFGLARDTRATVHQLTATGDVLGTPDYMAPEQATGIREEIGPATDIWALGAVLYRGLTGRPPHAAATPLAVL